MPSYPITEMSSGMLKPASGQGVVAASAEKSSGKMMQVGRCQQYGSAGVSSAQRSHIVVHRSGRTPPAPSTPVPRER